MLIPIVTWAQQAVDLGLSVKWGSCNLGASEPEEYGDFYAWGETKLHPSFYWDDYKWSGDHGINGPFFKYNFDSDFGRVDHKTVLDAADDVAHVKLGGKWRIPTEEEWDELIERCTCTWTSDYNGTGVEGLIVTSKTTGNRIFLSAAGRHRGSFREWGGYYWSSSLATDHPAFAGNLYFSSGYIATSSQERCSGLSVRPVTK